MKKVLSPLCVLCRDPEVEEDQIHFTLLCPILNNIREIFLIKFVAVNPSLNTIRENQQLFLISLLDPFSPILPEDVRQGWKDKNTPYEISRNYFAAIHKKRKNLIEKYEKSSYEEDNDELSTNLIFSIYEKQDLA